MLTKKALIPFCSDPQLKGVPKFYISTPSYHYISHKNEIIRSGMANYAWQAKSSLPLVFVWQMTGDWFLY